MFLVLIAKLPCSRGTDEGSEVVIDGGVVELEIVIVTLSNETVNSSSTV